MFDYFLFPKIQRELKGKKVNTDDEVREAVSAYFEDDQEKMSMSLLQINK